MPSELKCTEIFNNFLNCTIKELKIPFDPSLLEDVSMIKDPILAAVRKCKKHPSIPKIKEMIRKMTFFYLHHKDCDKMLNILQTLDHKKASQQGDIPVRIMKENKFFL